MISEKRKKHILKLASLPRTKKQIGVLRRMGKLPRTEKQIETSRFLMKKVSTRKRTKQWNLRVSQTLSGKPKKAIIQKVCEKCGKGFKAKSANRKFCEICCPNFKHSSIIRKYGLSKNELTDLLNKNNGLCWICLKRKAQVIDHNHKTNTVRGILCRYCNSSLNMVEDKKLLERALKYLTRL